LDILASISHYCRYQERCHAEVRNKLYELGCNKQEVEEHISQMISNGWLNEERFAKAFARGKFKMLHWGKVKIVQQLKLKQVSDYCIKKALQEINELDYRQTLSKLALTKFKTYKKQEHIRQRKSKLQLYLSQKGYEPKLIIEIINETIKTV
jgi:regulatory protein